MIVPNISTIIFKKDKNKVDELTRRQVNVLLVDRVNKRQSNRGTKFF